MRYAISEYLRRLAVWVSPRANVLIPPHPAHVPVVVLPADSSGVMMRSLNGWVIIQHEIDLLDE